MNKILKATNRTESQLKFVCDAFLEPSTMLMVSVKTNIRVPHICRYVAKLLKEGRIVLLKQDSCEISNKKAGFYTTDKHLFNQQGI